MSIHTKCFWIFVFFWNVISIRMIHGYIEIEASSNACYDARTRTFSSCSGGYDGLFYAPADGIIEGVKLVHNSGAVQCYTHYQGHYILSNWGLCAHVGVIIMSVTDETNYLGNVLYPVNGKTEGLDYWMSFPSGVNDNNGKLPNSYEISGFSQTSDYLIFMGPKYNVSKMDKFMLQYTEAYAQYSHSDNVGVGYASVYFLYANPTTMNEPTQLTYESTSTNIPTTIVSTDHTTSTTDHTTSATDDTTSATDNPNIYPHQKVSIEIKCVPEHGAGVSSWGMITGICNCVNVISNISEIACDESNIFIDWSTSYSVVIYSVTNNHYIQPWTNDYYTTISDLGLWSRGIHLGYEYEVDLVEFEDRWTVINTDSKDASEHDPQCISTGSTASNNPTTTVSTTGNSANKIEVNTFDNNCEANDEIKHINWDELQNAVDNSAQVPYSLFDMIVDKSTLEVEFNISLEYVGKATDGNINNNYNLGTTYVIDFQSFGTSGNILNEPGNCQNRFASSFQTETFDQWWNYSEYPTNNLGTNTYLAYPPPSEFWTLSIDPGMCTPITYNGIFSWNDLADCQDYNGNNLIEIIDDDTTITLYGTLYVNLVSPYSMSTTDTGIYRSFPLIQQDFEISLIKQINVLSSTGIDLFIASIIAINEDETDGSFELSILTQSADYIELINPIVLSTPLGAATITSVTSTCLLASSYTCGQIFTLRIDESQIVCPPADFTGIYNIQFDVNCPGNEAVCNTFIDANEAGSVALEVSSNFIDQTCEPELYEIIFDGEMRFYDDDQFGVIHNNQNGENNYVIGQDMIYIQVETNIPGDNFQIFSVEIDNVFVCTTDDNIDMNSNLDQQNGNGGCLSSNIDPNGPYNIISNGIGNDIYQTQIISNSGISNLVRFSFLTFDIGRTTMYVHVQLTLLLQNGMRRRFIGLHLLQSNDENTSSQMRHFIDSTIVSDTHIFVTQSRTDSSDACNEIKLTTVYYLAIVYVILVFV